MNHMLLVLGPAADVPLVFDQARRAVSGVTGRPQCIETSADGVALGVFPSDRTVPGDPLVSTCAGQVAGATAGALFFHGEGGPAANAALVEALAAAFDGPGTSKAAEICAPVDGFSAGFAICKGSREAFVVTDRIGAVHVFEASFGRCKVIATSSLALARLTRAPFDPHGFRQVMATGTLFETPRTLFEGIEKLDAARVFRFRYGGRTATESYWDARQVVRGERPAKGRVAELGDALVSAVETIGRAFERPLFDLSGGLDTRSLLGAALRAGMRPELVVNGPPGDPDVVASKHIAKTFGLTLHHRFDEIGETQALWDQIQDALPLCDGEVDAVSYSFISHVHRRMSKEFDITVNGCGGEFCKGYYWELLYPFLGQRGPLNAKRIASRRFVFDGDEPGLFAEPFEESLDRHMERVVATEVAGLDDCRNTAQLDLVYLRLRVQRFYGRIASSTSQIWPVASPYCFKDALEACLATPPLKRRAERMSRALNEHLHPELASLPLERGHPALPMRLTNLHRFSPLFRETTLAITRRVLRNLGVKLQEETWLPFTGNLRRSQLLEIEAVRSMLDPQTMTIAGRLDPDVVRDLVERWKGDSSLDHRVARLLTLELVGRAAREPLESAGLAEPSPPRPPASAVHWV